MPLPRLLVTLLALLSMTTGGPVPGGMLLCEAADHVSVESLAIGGHCETKSERLAEDHQPVVTSMERDCVDTAVAGVTADRSVIGAAAPMPDLSPSVLIAVLPEPEGLWVARDDGVRVAAPPAHLLPLRSFVLLT
ncbi:MAG: hypothetical protein AAF656_00025 [Planctomycetota bacterium]